MSPGILHMLHFDRFPIKSVNCVSVLFRCKLLKPGEDYALAATFHKQALGMLMPVITAAKPLCSC